MSATTSSPTKRPWRRGNSKPSETLEQIPTKTVFLIRHGQSLGQTVSPERRKQDPTLTDCALSSLGIQQAHDIPRFLATAPKIELVLTSPLTRAIQTTIIAFSDKPVVVHYDLRELGSPIPENTPRKIKHVLNDLRINPQNLQLDVDTFLPNYWPQHHNASPRVVRRDRIRAVFRWLATARMEQSIAVVCHYHVIRAALWNPYTSLGPPDLSPENAVPIQCELSADGRLRVVRILDSVSMEP